MFNRSDRLRVLFLEEISREFSELKDPGISGLVTVTALRLSADRKTAHVYYSVLGSVLDQASTARAMERCAGHVHRRLMQKLSLKRVPKIIFVFDETPEKAHRIEDLLARLHAQETGGVEPIEGDLGRLASSSRPRRRRR
ncbi:MAG: 30S ribosome-binding factor RbfA [Elusimicrobiota bacterium]|jgi:ribosome-binding factor A